MAKLSFFLVFSIVLALPFRSVIGQDWNDLVSQAGLTQDTLDEAKKAIGAANSMAGAAAGAAAGQEALNDYFGGSEDAVEAGASLADLIDNDGNNIVDAVSPSTESADSPAAGPAADSTSEILDDQETPDDDPIFGGPKLDEEAPTSSPSESPKSSESPISEAPEYDAPTNAPSQAPTANAPSRAPEADAPEADAPATNAPSRAPATNAPSISPELAPTNEPAEAPEDEDVDEDEDEDNVLPPMAAAPKTDDSK